MNDMLLFLQNHPLLTTALIVILVLVTILEYIKNKKSTHQLTPIQTTQLINHENAAIIDLRSIDHYTAGHIIGAISLPASELETKIKKIEKFKLQPIVLVCATGIESSRAAINLNKKGFQRIYLLQGGMRAWTEASMPIVK